MKTSTVKYILAHLLELRAGFCEREWDDIPSRTNLALAPFVHPCEMAAELELRLSYTGMDGFLLKQIYAWGESSFYLAGVLALPEWRIKKAVASAMGYITGKWPKQQSYQQHKAHFQWKKRALTVP